jgi:hypothetical protein
MKEYSQFQKIISVLVIFLLLMQLSGCYSYKIISSSDLPLSNSSKYSYIIHSQNSICQLKSTIISNGILSGKIDTMEDARHIGNKIHVYLLSDSLIKINTEKILSFPLDGTVKVEIGKVAGGKIIALLLGCTLGILMVVSIVVLNSGELP